MKLLIDNLDGRGPQDRTAFVDMTAGVIIARRLNKPSTLTLNLIGDGKGFVPPVSGARVLLVRRDGSNLFAGYLTAAPSCQYIGWGNEGAQYRNEITALSDAMVLDEKFPSTEPPFVAQTAGGAFRQLTLDAMPDWFDLSGVEAGDVIPYFSVDPAKSWVESATEIALAARCSYRDDAGKLFFTPLAQNTYSLAEGDPLFSPDGLQLKTVNRLTNDLTVFGQLEPQAHVKDYFVGDGYTSLFYLSQIPFTRKDEIAAYNRTILDEEYTELDPTHWVISGPANVFTVSGGMLDVAGGTGNDGQTCLEFVEEVELGGSTVLEHGDVVFDAASNGVIGGLYNGAVEIANCVAGFRVTPSGGNCSIQALVGGAVKGTPLTTQAGHHYVFTTYLNPTAIYRMQQVFHSSAHPSGNARGGGAIPCDVRVGLQVHDIDPANPVTEIAPATVLYDDVISNAPGFCTYALMNVEDMQCSVAFTYIYLAIDALVRTTLPQEATVTVQAGTLLEGAECRISNTPTLQFYPEYVPAANETIEVTYRSSGQAAARVMNSQSIQANQNGADDGVRSGVRHVGIPAPRTSADCEIAALALLDDAGAGWAGEYDIWSNSLPGGAADLFPGNGLAINVPSRLASLLAIVRAVDLLVVDLGGETVRYKLQFVDAGDPTLAFSFESVLVKQAHALTAIDMTEVGNAYVPDVSSAEATTITSTTVTIDVGFTPVEGSGIEVRYSDAGWGMGNNRNLIGRFTTSTFTLPRFARAQDYFLRGYDSSTPVRYSRYSTALHVDYPLD